MSLGAVAPPPVITCLVRCLFPQYHRVIKLIRRRIISIDGLRQHYIKHAAVPPTRDGKEPSLLGFGSIPISTANMLSVGHS